MQAGSAPDTATTVSTGLFSRLLMMAPAVALTLFAASPAWAQTTTSSAASTPPIASPDDAPTDRPEDAPVPGGAPDTDPEAAKPPKPGPKDAARKDAKPEVDKPRADEPKANKPKTPNSPRRGLSWTVLTGGIPDKGAIFQGEMGFSGLPRLAYHQSVGGGLSIGAMAAFDYAGNRPKDAFDSSLVFGPTVRFRPLPAGKLDLGLSGAVALRLPGQRGRDVALRVDLEASVGWLVEHRLVVGGGLAMPIAIGIGGVRDVVMDWPLLLGPFVEFHITPPVALTLDVKAGPAFASSGGTEVGLRALMGVAYRL